MVIWSYVVCVCRTPLMISHWLTYVNITDTLVLTVMYLL